ncbi:MEDS domain-containing protein [Winogradskya humida]|uniref:MEDS domain-containing protein n=1 Tax=Winogradskya humida TaxID=113566 RepID=A0ABQ3ZJW6_9ACTN|nr:MEDS domain-containing protein [Actinoplanes humidus]GIE18880.1 hypothetical protein Ahu01nite_019820 [Actinoplanes humidus]
MVTLDAPVSFGHGCVAFDDPAEFEVAARDFLAAGRAAGHRVRYVADRAPRGWDFEPELAHPATQYPPDGITDPAATVATWAAEVERALAGGHTGLSIAADTTWLVRDPLLRAGYARYEHLIDRYMRGHPLSGLCGFDRRILGDAVIAGLTCVHPDSDAPFRLYADSTGSSSAGLDGELDDSTREELKQALAHADLIPVNGEVVLQAAGLAFVDHRSLMQLDSWARRRGATAVLRTRRGTAARLAALLDLTALRVETIR